MKFAKKLRQLRQEQGLSQSALAEKVGLSKSSINMYERGEREPGFEIARKIADFFGVDTEYLLGFSPYRNKEEWLSAHPGKETRTVPLLGEIACGQPIFASEEYGQFAELPSGIRADFCLKAKGDSMVGARIMDGDLVFIRSQEQVENGAIAAVIIEDSATLKRVYLDPKKQILSLCAENPLYPPLLYSKEELEQVRILGKAVAFQSEI